MYILTVFELKKEKKRDYETLKKVTSLAMTESNLAHWGFHLTKLFIIEPDK